MLRGGLEQLATELAPEVSCVLFYRSLDCDLVGLDGCRAETDGRTPLEERVLENLPYSEIYEYGAHRPEIRLGVYPSFCGIRAPCPARKRNLVEPAPLLTSEATDDVDAPGPPVRRGR